jgi:cytochrome o ubiquinol oxidase operon protein cyoD
MRDHLHSYAIGFILSIFLTLVAYLFVEYRIFASQILLYTIMGLALLQLLVQLVFFLHLDHESGPRWNLATFISTISVILIMVIGSLWIMHNLNSYHTMSETQTNDYLLHEEGLHR